MKTVAVVGLGYVGLPLAVEFGRRRATIGYDVSVERVGHLQAFRDPTGEVSSDDLQAARLLTVTADPALLARADVLIIAVPTPVDDAHIPDFSPRMPRSTSLEFALGRNCTKCLFRKTKRVIPLNWKRCMLFSLPKPPGLVIHGKTKAQR